MSVTTGSIAAALLGELPYGRTHYPALRADPLTFFATTAAAVALDACALHARRLSLHLSKEHASPPARPHRLPPPAPLGAGVAGHAHKHWGSEFTTRAITVRAETALPVALHFLS